MQELAADAAVVMAPAFVEEMVMNLASGWGTDAVIITVVTKNNGLTRLAGQISWLRRRVVTIGDFGMNIYRRVYYPEKREYKISMSYGLGRYDRNYEKSMSITFTPVVGLHSEGIWKRFTSL